MVCTSCPRQCNVERTENTPSKGFCHMPYNAVLARAALHIWEEPPISFQKGSGAIFFSGCALRCIFCQNAAISHRDFGKPVSKAQFIEIMQQLEADGAENINLVNPSHFLPFLRDCLSEYKPKIPVVYNSGGYDSVESLRSLEGLIDIYLPDFKYWDKEKARMYAKAANYPETARAAILEMRRQVDDRFREDGKMLSGLLLRHLILPKNTADSIHILQWVQENLGTDTFISLMRQYTPYDTYPYKELNRRLCTAEYQKVLDAFFDLGFHNGFMQEKSSADCTFTPAFDLTGIQ